jgi:hypothetical protein
MFLFRWIGIVLAVPLSWLGQLASWVSVPMGRSLYAAAWRLGGDGETACRALAATARAYGEAAALAEARRWVEQAPGRRSCAPIAAHGGMLALQSGELDLARQMLAMGKQAGTDRNGVLELLEWMLTAGTGDGAAVEALARQLEARRDLPPVLSRQVLTARLWEAVQRQRFEEARQRAEHLLAIEEVPQARMALWVLAKREGDIRGAEEHLRQANLEPRHKLSFQILGNVAIGFMEEARALQAQLHKIDPVQAGLAGLALPARPEEPC